MTSENRESLSAGHMILIGATGRNSGKTTLALEIIQAFKMKFPIAAFKLITVRDREDICPRGGKGCGICKGLKGCFDIKEENGTGDKDTMLLKKAGAEKVWLLRAFKENVQEALEAALKLVPENALIICESNSARLAVKPACFIMIQSTATPCVKPTADAVMKYADVLLPQDETAFKDFVQKQLEKKIRPFFPET